MVDENDVEVVLAAPDAEVVVDVVPVDPEKVPPAEVPEHSALVQQVKDGKWGRGASLRVRLKAHGYDADAILAEVAQSK